MGRNSKNSKKKSGKERKELLAKELLRKKDCAKSQKQEELAKTTQNDCNAKNKSTDPPNSVKLLSVTNSENTEMECLPQIEEEKRNNSQEKIETSNEEGVLNGTIECCKDNEGLISVNANNIVEEMEGYIKEDTCNKTIEHYEDNKELVFTLPQIEETKDNEEKIEANNEEGVLNETIECCKNNEDLISVNANDVEETEKCTKEDTCNKTIEYYEDNKELVFTLPQIEDETKDNNEEKIEANNQKDVLNGTTECCKNNEDLISVNANDVEETEKCTKEDICNKTVEHHEDNKELASTLQIKEEKRDDSEEKIEANNEESVLNGTIECCKDNVDLISVNENNEEMEGYEKEDLCNKTVEHCEDNKEVVSTDIDNVEKMEDSKEEGIHNQNIECSENNKDNNSSTNTFFDVENLHCIVNVSYVYSELQKVYTNHMETNGIDCDFKYWKLVNYCRHGLLTELFFKCQKCHYEASIWSEPPGTEMPDINAVAVATSITTGMGYSRSNQLFASMGIVYMSEKTYNKYLKNLITKERYEYRK